MKARNQSGSAHIVIIVILVVALVGTLGFVFWQNFIQKDKVSETTPSNTTTTATTMTSLVVGNYGVEVPYDSTTDTYTLGDATTGGFSGGYTVYSKKVTEACGSNVNVGAIKRFNKGDSIPTPNNFVTIGAYDYALSIGGYVSCSTDAGMTVLTDASTAFAESFDNLKITK